MNAQIYQWLVGEIRGQCSTFITMPGLNSLYFFTGIVPPTRQNVGAWPTLFDAAKQREIRDRFVSLPGPRCAIRNLRMAANWLEGRKPVESPLPEYIAQHFVTISRRADWVSQYEFMVERTDGSAE
jgi:hypothetical protein